ncbi:MAG: DUF1611 domain-containing protein [Planctomycetaceae bacterium]|nr:DUF1611 domain-containing protein [Planctomycetaceae bacterium]
MSCDSSESSTSVSSGDNFNDRLLQHRRIVLLTDGYSTPFLAKTAISLLRYRTPDIAAVIDQSAAGQSAQQILGAGAEVPVVAGLADVSEADALYVGIAPPGGRFPEEWRPLILAALRRGMDVVSGLHEFLCDDREYVQAAADTGARLIDVRKNRHRSTAARHMFRTGCCRIHTVGHDCSVGKMVTSLEVQRGLLQKGLSAEFIATGQTGIMISGRGVPVDCVVSDFVNGAVEQLMIQNEHHDYLLVEGQGSISHPAFSAVTAGLLHGCAPDGLIFCYEAGRLQVKGLNEVDIPPLQQQMQAFEVMARLRHPCQIIGIAVNTRNLTPEQAEKELADAESTFGLPACDVYRFGAQKLVDACIELRQRLVS